MGLHPNQSPPGDSSLPDEPDRKKHAPPGKSSVVLVVYFVVGIFIVLLIVGLVNKFNLISSLSMMVGNREGITIVTSSTVGSESVVVMEVRSKDRSEIRLLVPETKEVKFVSKVNNNSFSPVKSPTTEQVAYLTKFDSDEIKLEVGSPGEIITDTVSTETLESTSWPNLRLCPNTTIAWSPDGTHLSVFVCDKKTTTSFVLVTDVGKRNRVLELTKDNSNRPRSAVWSDDTHLVYTQSDIDADVVYWLDVANPDAEPIRVFGP